MTKTAAVSCTEARVDRPDQADAPGPRVPVETEADKVRRQLHLRRKITLARRALAAHRR
jgi:hypothetical protein